MHQNHRKHSFQPVHTTSAYPTSISCAASGSQVFVLQLSAARASSSLQGVGTSPGSHSHTEQACSEHMESSGHSGQSQ
jgi:hypothetical protein